MWGFLAENPLSEAAHLTRKLFRLFVNTRKLLLKGYYIGKETF